MKPRQRLCAVIGVTLATFLGVSMLTPGALADPWHRMLKPGMSGADVRALQVRLAGWYPNKHKVKFRIDHHYGRQTGLAVRRFRAHIGIDPQRIAGHKVFRALNRLTDRNGSTAHFDWSEFVQNYNSGCSAKANAYARTLSGGAVSHRRTRRNVRWLMWRLEAVRAKGGSHALGINSGFRSIPYNQCIGGASASQHLFGDAADNRLSSTSNRRERRLAKRSQFSGIGCYSNLSHNHFDLRVHNKFFPYGQFWWWPQRDGSGRDLDESGRPCWGEGSRGGRVTAGTSAPASGVLAQVARAEAGAGSLVPSRLEVRTFARAGEPDDLGAGD
jgi:zinc D-Ala-D-Ala carboxypeptidase